MNFYLISRSIGTLLLLIAMAMVFCVTLGYLVPAGSGHNPDIAFRGWCFSILATVVSALILRFLGRSAKREVMLKRDAIATVGMAWIVCTFFPSLPYMFCEPHLPFSMAIFEGVSGLTTTGATVLTDYVTLPETILLWRSITQWIGGIGILAIFVLVLSGLGASGKSLLMAESTAHAREFMGSTTHQNVSYLWGLYIVLTLICGVGQWALGMSPFQAVNHAMTTVATGGFGTEADSFSGFGISIRLWTILFMFLGGVSFPLYVALLRKGSTWDLLKRHEETWIFVIILVFVSSAILSIRGLAGQLDDSWLDGTVDTLFNVISIATTTGYAVGDYNLWPSLAKGLLLLAIVVGGCAGSTSGGLKVARLILWFKVLRIEIRHAYRPNQFFRLRLNGNSVPDGTRGQLFVILTSAVATIAVSSYLLIGLEPDISPLGSISAVISSVSNVGPAFEEFGPTQNYASLSPVSLILLSVLMIVGRLEYIALLVLLSRTLWRKY